MRCPACHNEIADDSAFCPRCGEKQPQAGPATPYEYAAFISYRHLSRDQEVAKRVQRAIEAFKMPRGASAGGARKLGKCFRDEDELPASHSLPDRIVEALGRSGALVVVCTPDTQNSDWVRREIEAFIGMHGRERVFAVLADGSSSESIPELLRADAGRGGAQGHSGPLAADLRPQAAGRPRDEMMRLIAGIAGCGYDDLKQRDRARRRKAAALAAVAAVAVAAALAGAIAFGAGAHRDALVAESHRLAGESAQLLSQGDRYGAIEKALEALPQSEASNDRPFVPEARLALEDALLLEYDPNRFWLPWYSLDVGSDDTMMAISPDKGWFAILKPDMVIDFYDTLTGKRLSTTNLRDSMKDGGKELDTNLDHWSLFVAGNYLVAAERAAKYSSFCIEAPTGYVTWAQDLQIDAIAVSPDNSAAGLFVNTPNGVFAGTYRIPNGEWSGSVGFDSSQAPQFAGVLCSAASEHANTLFVGFDNVVGKYDLSTGTCTMSEPLGGNMVLTVALSDDKVVATSILLDEPANSEEPASAKCLITALDAATMQTVWSREVRWYPKPVFVNTAYMNVESEPRADEFGLFGEPAVICVAGGLVQAYALSDGAIIFDYDFPEVVVGAQAYSKRDGYDYLNVACADGTVYFSVPSREKQAPAPVCLTYPGPISESTTFWSRGTDIMSIARSLEHPERYLVYRAEWKTADTAKTAESYTLDELIGQAHEQLGAIAQ